MNNLIDLFTHLIAIAVVLAVLYYLFDLITTNEIDNPGPNDQNEK
jgi:hypothetical protein